MIQSKTETVVVKSLYIYPTERCLLYYYKPSFHEAQKSYQRILPKGDWCLKIVLGIFSDYQLGIKMSDFVTVHVITVTVCSIVL